MVGSEGCGYAMLQLTSAPTLDLVTLCNGPVPTHTPSSSPSPCSPPLFNGLPTAVLYELLRDGEARLQPVALSCLYVLQEDTEQFGGHLHVHPQPVQDHPHHILWGGGGGGGNAITGCTTWHSLTGRAMRHSLTGEVCAHTHTPQAHTHTLCECVVHLVWEATAPR